MLSPGRSAGLKKRSFFFNCPKKFVKFFKAVRPVKDLLPFYAILRSIPNKLLGVLAMFGSLFILLILPITDLSRIRGNKFRPAMKLAFWFFVVDFIILMWIGSQHPTTPFVEVGQIATAFYFAWFLVIVPIIGISENTLNDLQTTNKTNSN
jgi:ubiquinol-cytochrome c reductase cytochrome b subunit